MLAAVELLRKSCLCFSPVVIGVRNFYINKCKCYTFIKFTVKFVIKFGIAVDLLKLIEISPDNIFVS
jgi:hypothetical protein